MVIAIGTPGWCGSMGRAEEWASDGKVTGSVLAQSTSPGCRFSPPSIGGRGACRGQLIHLSQNQEEGFKRRIPGPGWEGSLLLKRTPKLGEAFAVPSEPKASHLPPQPMGQASWSGRGPPVCPAGGPPAPARRVDWPAAPLASSRGPDKGAQLQGGEKAKPQVFLLEKAARVGSHRKFSASQPGGVGLWQNSPFTRQEF